MTAFDHRSTDTLRHPCRPARLTPRGRRPRHTPFSSSSFPSFSSVTILLLLLFTTASPAAETPKRGGTLRLAVETDPRSLDAAQVFSNEEATLAYFLYNTLIDPLPNGGFIPVLTESLPTTSTDGLTHTFRLRQGVRFSDGNELTADDVVYTFERMFDPRVGAASTAWFRSIAGNLEFENARKQEAAAPPEVQARHPMGRWIEPLVMDGLKVVDRYTVQIRLNQPDLAFLSILATPYGGIVPRKAAEAAGRRFASRPVGTGPFRIAQWVRGSGIRFDRNPYYFRAEHPRPTGVDVFVNLDRSTQAMMFERGEIDFQSNIADADFLRLKRSPRFQETLRVVDGSIPTFVFLNCGLPPFSNRLVRLALNHAVDRQAYAKALLHRAVPARGPLPLTVRGFSEGLPPYEFNPTKARALLTEAGFPDGFRSTLWVSRENNTWMKVALLVQESLRKVGVIVELKVVSYPAMLDFSGRRGAVPMGVWDWVSAIDDPKETLDSLLNGNNITEEGCMNTSFYANPHVMQLFRDGVAEADPARRLDIYRQIERLIVEDAPWIFLVQCNSEMLVQPWLKGFSPRGFWPPVRLENCWLEKQ